MIRALRLEDIDKIREIHKKFYSKEFEFPNFLHNFVCCFVTIDNDELISATGIRNIAEMITITDQDKSLRKRTESYFAMLDASAYIAGKSGHDQLHVFIQDSKWEHILGKIGFLPTVGKSLVLNL